MEWALENLQQKIREINVANGDEGPAFFLSAASDGEPLGLSVRFAKVRFSGELYHLWGEIVRIVAQAGHSSVLVTSSEGAFFQGYIEMLVNARQRTFTTERLLQMIAELSDLFFEFKL